MDLFALVKKIPFKPSKSDTRDTDKGLSTSSTSSPVLLLFPFNQRCKSASINQTLNAFVTLNSTEWIPPSNKVPKNGVTSMS
ncbi:hypothetical protein Fmac_020236 [Flemingia macrophylla]|uniref:Uncharacterized protein n=1 Tax=Flemingia macrophylla TaxID=520843 RepID=A0ABD1LTF9_9FABA